MREPAAWLWLCDLATRRSTRVTDLIVRVGQGERDGNLVPSDAIFAALQRLDKPIEYRLYGGEGHVISREANVLDF